VRTRHAQPLVDVRQLGEIIEAFESRGFVQIHRSWAVNLRRVRETRPAPEGGWEVKLDPPVNRVLPVSRRRISALWERFGE
jgi:DNA-binding LytR/AlgR family response regulator